MPYCCLYLHLMTILPKQIEKIKSSKKNAEKRVKYLSLVNAYEIFLLDWSPVIFYDPVCTFLDRYSVTHCCLVSPQLYVLLREYRRLLQQSTVLWVQNACTLYALLYSHYSFVLWESNSFDGLKEIARLENREVHPCVLWVSLSNS